MTSEQGEADEVPGRENRRMLRMAVKRVIDRFSKCLDRFQKVPRTEPVGPILSEGLRDPEEYNAGAYGAPVASIKQPGGVSKARISTLLAVQSPDFPKSSEERVPAFRRFLELRPTAKGLVGRGKKELLNRLSDHFPDDVQDDAMEIIKNFYAQDIERWLRSCGESPASPDTLDCAINWEEVTDSEFIAVSYTHLTLPTKRIV